MRLKKRRFLAVNSSISGGAGSKLQSETCTVSFGNQSGMQKRLFITEYCKSCTVSRSIKPVITSKLQRRMTKYEEKVLVFLTKTVIFT